MPDMPNLDAGRTNRCLSVENGAVNGPPSAIRGRSGLRRITYGCCSVVDTVGTVPLHRRCYRVGATADFRYSPAALAGKPEGPPAGHHRDVSGPPEQIIEYVGRSARILSCRRRSRAPSPKRSGQETEEGGWPDAPGEVDSQALIDTVNESQCTPGTAKPVRRPPSHCPWPTRPEPPRLLLVGDPDQTLSPPQADPADPAVADAAAPRLFAQSLPVAHAEASPPASLSESSHKRGRLVQPPALLLDQQAPPPDIERPLPPHRGRAAGDSAYRLRSGRFSRSSGRLPAPRLPPRRGLAA